MRIPTSEDNISSHFAKGVQSLCQEKNHPIIRKGITRLICGVAASAFNLVDLTYNVTAAVIKTPFALIGRFTQVPKALSGKEVLNHLNKALVFLILTPLSSLIGFFSPLSLVNLYFGETPEKKAPVDQEKKHSSFSQKEKIEPRNNETCFELSKNETPVVPLTEDVLSEKIEEISFSPEVTQPVKESSAIPAGEFSPEKTEDSFVNFSDSEEPSSLESTKFSRVSESALSAGSPAGTAEESSTTEPVSIEINQTATVKAASLFNNTIESVANAVAPLGNAIERARNAITIRA